MNKKEQVINITASWKVLLEKKCTFSQILKRNRMLSYCQTIQQILMRNTLDFLHHDENVDLDQISPITVYFHESQSEPVPSFYFKTKLKDCDFQVFQFNSSSILSLIISRKVWGIYTPKTYILKKIMMSTKNVIVLNLIK